MNVIPVELVSDGIIGTCTQETFDQSSGAAKSARANMLAAVAVCGVTSKPASPVEPGSVPTAAAHSVCVATVAPLNDAVRPSFDV